VFGTALGVAVGNLVQSIVTVQLLDSQNDKDESDKMSKALIWFLAFLASFTAAAVTFLLLWFFFGFGYSANNN